MGVISLLFVPTGFDDIPEIAVPVVRRLLAFVEQRRNGTVGIAQTLPEVHRLGLLRDFRTPTVIEFGARIGLSAAESCEIANLANAVEKVPEVAEQVKKGEISVHGAGILGWAIENKDLVAAKPAGGTDPTSGASSASEGVPDRAAKETVQSLHEAAQTMPARELRDFVDRRIQEIRHDGGPVRPVTLQVAATYCKKFERVRELASQKEGEYVSRDRAFEIALDYYLDHRDSRRRKPRKRRMPVTGAKRTRRVPDEVRRAVLERTDGRCSFPACANRTWVEMAHRVPWRLGGSQEKDNLDGLCSDHHRRVDAGEFRIEGSTEAPVFYDGKGRRIGRNGLPIERGRDRGRGGKSGSDPKGGPAPP